MSANDAPLYHRVVDLDVDIGADAVDYKCVHYKYSFRVVSNSLLCSFLPRKFQHPTTSYLITLHSTPTHRAILCLPSATPPATRRYSAIAAKESLSGLETEMRKLEGLVKEIQDELDYLKRREMRFQSTNGKLRPSLFRAPLSPCVFCSRFAWCDSYGGV